MGTGYFFGFCLTTIFTFRLFVEYFKEVQEPWELHMQNLIGLNQGQLLSLPFMAIGIYCLLGCKLPKAWKDNPLCKPTVQHWGESSAGASGEECF